MKARLTVEKLPELEVPEEQLVEDDGQQVFIDEPKYLVVKLLTACFILNPFGCCSLYHTASAMRADLLGYRRRALTISAKASKMLIWAIILCIAIVAYILLFGKLNRWFAKVVTDHADYNHSCVKEVRCTDANNSCSDIYHCKFPYEPFVSELEAWYAM